MLFISWRGADRKEFLLGFKHFKSIYFSHIGPLISKSCDIIEYDVN